MTRSHLTRQRSLARSIPGLTCIVLLALGASAEAAPKKDAPSAAQKEADRHFKSGVALFNEAKYTEALAEFERAYEIAPHPLVLYNIAACYRELSRYGEAVKFYRRFLTEGKGKVPPARLTTAKTELDGVLARIARVTVTVAGADGATLVLDGNALGTMPLDMPLIVPPGEHKLIARAQGRRDAERTVRVASGDEVEVALTFTELPADGTTTAATTMPTETGVTTTVTTPTSSRKRFAIGASFGTNLRRVAETGAPSLGVGVTLHSRVELGVDAVLVAYAVMPSVRVRLAGSALSVHAAVAVPIAFTDGDMSETFVAGAVGLGVRYRPMPSFAVRLEGFASFAGKTHGTTVPAFIGGELWF